MSQRLLKGRGRRGRTRVIRNVDVRQNKRLRRIEKRMRDTEEIMFDEFNISAVQMNATPVVLHITPDAQGDGVKSRMLLFEIHGVVKQDLASAIVDDYRMDLVLDKTPNKLAQLPLNTYGSATPTTETLLNPGFFKRFRILKTWRGYLSSSEGSNTFRKFDAKMKLRLVVETATDGDFAFNQIIRNNLSLIRWTTATAAQPTITFSSRLSFTE